MNDASSGRTPARTHEAFWASDLFDQGIGWVIVARFKAEGQRVQVGVFLVDVFSHLERRCGSGNYNYTVLLGHAEDITRALEL